MSEDTTVSYVTHEELLEYLYDDSYDLRLVREDGKKLEYEKALVVHEDKFNAFVKKGYKFSWGSENDPLAFEFNLYLIFDEYLEDVEITYTELLDKADNDAYELQLIRNHDGAWLDIQKEWIIHEDQIYAFIRHGYTLRWRPENELPASEFNLDNWPSTNGYWPE